MADPPAFKFVIATQSRPKHDSSVVSEIRAHSARMIHRARRKKREAQSTRLEDSKEHKWLPRTSTPIGQRSPSSEESNLQKLTLPTLFGGNSDPFGAAAIEITPEMNELLTFARDVVYPKFQFNRFFRQLSSDPNLDLSVTSNTICITSFPANEHWEFLISTLTNEPSALAVMSTAAAYMATVKPSHKVTALELRLKSSKNLRRLLLNQQPEKFSLVVTLFWLFNAETRAGNFDAAATLCRMLAPLLKQALETGKISLMVIMEFRVVEDDVATHNLSRVVFDMDQWFPRLFEADWKQAELLLPPYPSSVNDIHPAVKGSLRQHFHNLRWIYFYWDHLFHCDSPPDQQLVFRWFMSRYQWVSGCLLNSYADLAECVHGSGPDGLQCLLTLTALNHTRIIGTSSVIGSFDYRGASEPLVRQIMRLTARLSATPTGDTNLADALFWVLYLGNIWETLRSTAAENAWFLPRLLIHARAHKVRTWEGCRLILKSFFFVEKDVPCGEEWFQRAVNEYVLMEEPCNSFG